MTPQTYYCSECGRATAPEELARFGDRLVCPYCKDAYAQKLREGVAPAGYVRFGGFWLRFVAYFIDSIILGIPFGILGMLLIGGTMLPMTRIGQNAAPEDVLAAMMPMFGAMAVLSLVGMVLYCAYEAFFLVKYGATPGKMALGLKVVRPDGSGIQPGRAIGRYFAKILSGMILYIGYIMVGFDAQKRGLHDMICDTRVIKTRG
jgi:DNA-directed RNA polymerase subunit RPC12/RpoP